MICAGLPSCSWPMYSISDYSNILWRLYVFYIQLFLFVCLLLCIGNGLVVSFFYCAKGSFIQCLLYMWILLYYFPVAFLQWALMLLLLLLLHIIHYIFILSRVILQLNIDNIPYGSLLFRAIFDFQTLLLLLVSCNSVAVLNPHTRIRKMRNKQMFRSGTPKLTVRRIKEVEMKANTQKAAWKPMHEDKKANTRKKQQNSSRHKRRVERQKKPQDVALWSQQIDAVANLITLRNCSVVPRMAIVYCMYAHVYCEFNIQSYLQKNPLYIGPLWLLQL